VFTDTQVPAEHFASPKKKNHARARAEIAKKENKKEEKRARAPGRPLKPL
jgi:hypothetical protein